MPSAFWTFAKSMLRHRAMLLGTIAMVGVSSLTLGVGLAGAKPILDGLLGGTKALPELALELNKALSTNTIARALGGVQIPQAWIDQLPKDHFTGLVWIMASLALLAVVGSIANFFHSFFSLTIVHRVMTDIRRDAFHSVIRAPLSRAVKDGTSDWVSRIVNDVQALGGGFNQLLSKAVLQVFKGVAAMVVALYFDWRATLGAILVAPVLYTIIRKLGKRIRRAAGAALQSQARMLHTAQQSLQALRVVKLNNAERRESGRFHRINKDVMREMNRVRTVRSLASPLTEMLSIFLLCALVLLAAWYMQRQNVPPGNFLLALMALGVAGASLKPLTGIVNDIQSASPAADRLQMMLGIERESWHDRRLPKLTPHSRSIEFKDLSFTYPGAPAPALREVSIAVPHAQRLVVVGPNGSGKTTLLSLLPRLYDPDTGVVLVDGVDVKSVSIRSLRSQIAAVTQDVVLFADTIAANIAYGAEGVTDADIVAAATKARAHEFISALPNAYDTLLSEQGAGLSGGQRQRISIARAILRNPRILLLDEATSMIDTESEHAIAEALAEFSRGRTTITVAHRALTIQNAERIVVLDAGRVVDDGRHAELMDRCEVYRRIIGESV